MYIPEVPEVGMGSKWQNERRELCSEQKTRRVLKLEVVERSVEELVMMELDEKVYGSVLDKDQYNNLVVKNEIKSNENQTKKILSLLHLWVNPGLIVARDHPGQSGSQEVLTSGEGYVRGNVQDGWEGLWMKHEKQRVIIPGVEAGKVLDTWFGLEETVM